MYYPVSVPTYQIEQQSIPLVHMHISKTYAKKPTQRRHPQIIVHTASISLRSLRATYISCYFIVFNSYPQHRWLAIILSTYNEVPVDIFNVQIWPYRCTKSSNRIKPYHVAGNYKPMNHHFHHMSKW
jgi:hypothetical protein